mgnify:CR=1 FL=1
MKKIYKSIKLIALLVACLAIPSLAGAQVVKNMYFNIDITRYLYYHKR